jgi:hypothetical protein
MFSFLFLPGVPPARGAGVATLRARAFALGRSATRCAALRSAHAGAAADHPAQPAAEPAASGGGREAEPERAPPGGVHLPLRCGARPRRPGWSPPGRPEVFPARRSLPGGGAGRGPRRQVVGGPGNAGAAARRRRARAAGLGGGALPPPAGSRGGAGARRPGDPAGHDRLPSPVGVGPRPGSLLPSSRPTARQARGAAPRGPGGPPRRRRSGGGGGRRRARGGGALGRGFGAMASAAAAGPRGAGPGGRGAPRRAVGRGVPGGAARGAVAGAVEVDLAPP